MVYLILGDLSRWIESTHSCIVTLMELSIYACHLITKNPEKSFAKGTPSLYYYEKSGKIFC